MLDIWYTFPAILEKEMIWVSYNHSYSEILKKDTRDKLLKVKVEFNNPTKNGMLSSEEFPQILNLDEILDNNITENGGIYVGRITLNGSRIFYFYVNDSEKNLKKIIKNISISTNYELRYIYEVDLNKKHYWNELYPNDDYWQVIQDLKILSYLEKEGDNQNIKRKINHYCYFNVEKNKDKFILWLKDKKYINIKVNKVKSEFEYLIEFNHIGTINLSDITYHTISVNHKVKELNGIYDGWESPITINSNYEEKNE